jgi:hypothetical protein
MERGDETEGVDDTWNRREVHICVECRKHRAMDLCYSDAIHFRGPDHFQERPLSWLRVFVYEHRRSMSCICNFSFNSQVNRHAKEAGQFRTKRIVKKRFDGWLQFLEKFSDFLKRWRIFVL